MQHPIALLLLIGCIGVALADIPPNQTQETQLFSSATNVICDGTFKESDSIGLEVSTDELDNSLALPTSSMTPWERYSDDNYISILNTPWGRFIALVENSETTPIAPGDIAVWDNITRFGEPDPRYTQKLPGEVRHTTTYCEDTVGFSGLISYSKSLTIDTKNSAGSGNNLEADKVVTFLGDEGGSIASDESLFMSSAGQIGWTDNLFSCAFSPGGSELYPPFCNNAEMGSSVSLQQASLITSTSDRGIAAMADVPVSMDYAVSVTGVGGSPAHGMVSAYGTVHSSEGMITKMWSMQDWYSSYRPGLASELELQERTQIDGDITTFSKKMSYTVRNR